MNLPLKGRIGALAVLSGCFFLSALLRTGEVAASFKQLQDDGFGNLIATQPAAPRKAGEGDTPASANDLIEELARQRTSLAAREQKVKDREAMLEAMEVRLRGRLEELEKAQARLAKTAALVEDAAEKDVRHLAEMYQQMKPKQASLIFNEMAPSFAAGFLAQMRSDAAALILANMEADKAYAVSLLLAGRNIGRGGDADLQ
ncbi:MAG: hypothetical protein AAF713_10955 [Pseudomonadota bacterium]